MAALDIIVNDLTDGSLSVDNEWTGTGVFDKLIAAVNSNIEGQYNKGRITGSDYAQVYLGSMQSVLAQSVEFLLREKETEARVDLIREQIDTAIYERTVIQPKQLEKLEEEIDLLQTQDSEMILNGEKERTLKDAQITGLNKDNEVKTEQVTMSIFERQFIQPKQLEKLEEEIDLLQTNDNNAKIEGAAIKAKVLDEHGRHITTEYELAFAADSETKHFHGVDLLTNQVLTEAKKIELTDAQVRTADKEAVMLHGKIEQELNGVYTPATDTTPESWAFGKAAVTGNDTDGYKLEWWKTNGGAVETNPYLMNLYRQYEENQIAKSTARGYKADGIYKAYKSLQEMFFALANLGIEPGDSDSINNDAGVNNNPYVSIMKSMQDLINAHMDVWDSTIADIKLTQVK